MRKRVLISVAVLAFVAGLVAFPPATPAAIETAPSFRLRVGLYQLGFPTQVTITPSNGSLEIYDPALRRTLHTGRLPEVTVVADAQDVAVMSGPTVITRSPTPLLFSAVGRPPSHLLIQVGRGASRPGPSGKGAWAVGGPEVAPPRNLHAYRGSLALAPWKGRLFAVNVVDLEDYLKGVVPAEMGDQAPRASFEAQAIAARTYALRNRKRHAASGFDLCDRVHCQVYPGMLAELPASSQAVYRTHGEVVLYEGQFANTVYHARCGGRLASSKAVWGGQDVPYLPAHDDSLGQGGYFCNLALDEIKAGVTALEHRPIVRAAPVPRYRRVLRPSRGHRVGMCQDGAIGMGLAGHSKTAILGFYYPGTRLALMREATTRPPPPPPTTVVTRPGASPRPDSPSLKETMTQIARVDPSVAVAPVPSAGGPAAGIFHKWFWSVMPPRRSPREAFAPRPFPPANPDGGNRVPVRVGEVPSDSPPKAG